MAEDGRRLAQLAGLGREQSLPLRVGRRQFSRSDTVPVAAEASCRREMAAAAADGQAAPGFSLRKLGRSATNLGHDVMVLVQQAEGSEAAAATAPAATDELGVEPSTRPWENADADDVNLEI